MPSQLSFNTQSFQEESRTRHGGELRQGRRKLHRPVATKCPMHVILKSTRAVRSHSMLSPRFKSKIQHLVLTLADKNGVRIREYANSGNHLHLLVQAKTREGFQKFLRTLTGLIARLITGAKKGNPQGRFWDHLAFSRIVQWGRAFTIARAYVQRNFFEAEELIPYQSRKSTHLAQVLRPARP